MIGSAAQLRWLTRLPAQEAGKLTIQISLKAGLRPIQIMTSLDLLVSKSVQSQCCLKTLKLQFYFSKVLSSLSFNIWSIVKA